MTYDKKLLLAKMLVSAGLIAFTVLPIIAGDYMGSENWSRSAQFHLAGTLYGHVLALPIMLWAIWSTRLFGTARSVRLMAYLGMAFVLGFFLAGTRGTLLGMGMDMRVNGGIFLLLLAGTLLSIRRGNHH